MKTPRIYRGFTMPKAGRIHFRCYVCGRRQSNNARETFDPTNAVLLEFPCPKCADKDSPEHYFDQEVLPLGGAA